METAWSCMWNVTDETPINCKRFLDGGGMQLFLQCKDKFPDKLDLLRNMMGLLGNVAEVPSLRPQLMTKEFVSEFSFLLSSSSDGIEVRSNLHQLQWKGPTDFQFVANRLATTLLESWPTWLATARARGPLRSPAERRSSKG